VTARKNRLSPPCLSSLPKHLMSVVDPGQNSVPAGILICRWSDKKPIDEEAALAAVGNRESPVRPITGGAL